MTKVDEYRTARGLRKEGKSFSQIKQVLKISKSTLSRWLKDIPLTDNQIRKLRAESEIRIERFRQTMQNKRDLRLAEYLKNARTKILPLNQRELFITGLMLYWGEGNKGIKASVSLNNTDPDVMKFYLYWLKSGLNVSFSKIKVYLHLYKDMNVDEEIRYWSKELKIPKKYFRKPYIKESKRSEINHKGFGHGTCAVVINDVRLKEKILMSIKAVADYYSLRI